MGNSQGSAEDAFLDWQSVLDAPGSALFAGRTADRIHDRAGGAELSLTDAALFTQSNARVLIGHSADGSFGFIALPTRVYAAPTSEGELGLGAGMYYRFDTALYAGGLSYRIEFDGSGDVADLAADDRDNRTRYADHFLPLTRTRVGDLEVALVSVAPVAIDASAAALSPAPLPGPAGALYVLHLRNTGSRPLSGRVVLRAGDLLIGDYEDARPALRSLKRPTVDIRQETLILSRPEGSVGIHLHDGRWGGLEAPFEAQRSWVLETGEEAVFETLVAAGATHGDVLPVVYELHRRSPLEWLNMTTRFWRSRIGRLEVADGNTDGLAEFSRDVYIRCLFDNFNCLQTDEAGNLLANWQGGPSEPHAMIWGIDVEPTAVSIVNLCPEIVRQSLLFFMTRSRAPRGPNDHSIPILVGPLIIARQWLAATGDLAFFEGRPDVLVALQQIVDDLLSLKAPSHTLFPTRYSSDGPVGRRYDYGTNAKVVYALDSFGYILRRLGRIDEASRYEQIATTVRSDIERTMVVDGPFGPQISGGTNLGESPGSFYLPESVAYYDGEDTSTMLAPLYGACDETNEPWINYHRFARSLWCPNYDPEFDTLRWSPGEIAVIDGTAFFSRVAGSVTREEMREGMTTLREVGTDEVTGSVFWWPHGLEYRRAMTRCNQGQGAWAWYYLERWLGLTVDAGQQVLTLDPRGLITKLDWRGFAAGPNRFDVAWSETGENATVAITNLNSVPWTIHVGFRGASAQGSFSAWDVLPVEPGETATFSLPVSPRTSDTGHVRSALVERETLALGDSTGVLFRRFGAAVLWGHWDRDRRWDRSAMPFSLRFVIQNATDADWFDVAVRLTCPDGWTAQARPARHWPRPDSLAPGSVDLSLGAVPARGRGIAPFWVRGPRDYAVEPSWLDRTRAFHVDSQPAAGLTIRTPDVDVDTTYVFEAAMTARTSSGRKIQRRLEIPIELVPWFGDRD